MENLIINSLKRLERVGAENSKVTEKLKKAVSEVTQRIIDVIKEYCNDVCNNYYCDQFKQVNLPRGYRAIYVDTEQSEYWTIIVPGQDEFQDHPYSRALGHKDDVKREDALQFAKDVSEGLLSEIADFIENETKQAIDAEKEIKKAVIEEIEDATQGRR